MFGVVVPHGGRYECCCHGVKAVRSHIMRIGFIFYASFNQRYRDATPTIGKIRKFGLVLSMVVYLPIIDSS